MQISKGAEYWQWGARFIIHILFRGVPVKKKHPVHTYTLTSFNLVLNLTLDIGQVLLEQEARTTGWPCKKDRGNYAAKYWFPIDSPSHTCQL